MVTPNFFVTDVLDASLQQESFVWETSVQVFLLALSMPSYPIPYH